LRLDKSRARAAFERAVQSYDRAAVLQREVGQRLLEWLDYVRVQPARVLDVGAGTGYCTQALAKRYPKARLIAADIAYNMLASARRQLSWWQRRRGRFSYACADAEALPFADASVDLIVSNLTLQWCADLERTFAEFRRVLAPGGLLMFSTFGPDTLKELRAAWGETDAYVHVHSFVDMHDIGDALLRTRFADPVMNMEYITVTYPDVVTLMRDLKHLGAHNASPARRHALTGKGRLRRVQQCYEGYRTGGLLPATHEVIYGHAWVADRAATGKGGVARVSFDDLRTRA
jgi:malonyl-CoA O-methyltransferase